MKRSLAFLILASLLGLACEQRAVIAWSSPLAGVRKTWMPLDLAVDFVEKDALLETFRITLNGNDVTSLFGLDAPVNGRVSARAQRVWGPGLVAPGENVLRAEVSYPSATYFQEIAFTTEGDPYADAVPHFAPGPGGGFGGANLPGRVIGPPVGGGLFAGGLDVVSLGASGRIVLAFTNNVIVNGPGPDFTVFENPFLGIGAYSITGNPFAEPGRVRVSQDGVTWFELPCAIDEPPYYPGCAGVFPVLSSSANPASPHASVPTDVPIASLVGVSLFGLALPPGSGGDSFDLDAVGLPWARFVEIEASPSATGPEGADNARFDLDAITAVHSAPATDADGDGIPDAVE